MSNEGLTINRCIFKISLGSPQAASSTTYLGPFSRVVKNMHHSVFLVLEDVSFFFFNNDVSSEETYHCKSKKQNLFKSIQLQVTQQEFLSFWIISKTVFSKLFAFGLPGLIQPLHSESTVSTPHPSYVSRGFCASTELEKTREAGGGPVRKDGLCPERAVR